MAERFVFVVNNRCMLIGLSLLLSWCANREASTANEISKAALDVSTSVNEPRLLATIKDPRICAEKRNVNRPFSFDDIRRVTLTGEVLLQNFGDTPALNTFIESQFIYSARGGDKHAVNARVFLVDDPLYSGRVLDDESRRSMLPILDKAEKARARLWGNLPTDRSLLPSQFNAELRIMVSYHSILDSCFKAATSYRMQPIAPEFPQEDRCMMFYEYPYVYAPRTYELNEASCDEMSDRLKEIIQQDQLDPPDSSEKIDS